MPAPNERICLLCQQNCVEDEAHFLFECDLYTAERNQFETDINTNFNVLSMENKFQTAFEHPFRLGRFIKIAMNKRKAMLYKANSS